jgi:hypothetical protein
VGYKELTMYSHGAPHGKESAREVGYTRSGLHAKWATRKVGYKQSGLQGSHDVRARRPATPPAKCSAMWATHKVGYTLSGLQVAHFVRANGSQGGLQAKWATRSSL